MFEEALDLYSALFEPYADSFLGFIQKTEEAVLHTLASEGLERAIELLLEELEKEVLKERRFYLELAVACLEHYGGHQSSLYEIYDKLNEKDGYLHTYYSELAGFDFEKFSPEISEVRKDSIYINFHPLIKALYKVSSYGVFHEYYSLFADTIEVCRFSKVYFYAKSSDSNDEEIFNITNEDWELFEKAGAFWTIHGWLVSQADIFGHLRVIRKFRHHQEPILMYPFYEYAKVLIKKWSRALDALRKYSRFLTENNAFSNAYRVVLCRLEDKICPEPRSLTAKKLLEVDRY
ncbi:hypothetical protein [Thermocrinis sp.]